MNRDSRSLSKSLTSFIFFGDDTADLTCDVKVFSHASSLLSPKGPSETRDVGNKIKEKLPNIIMQYLAEGDRKKRASCKKRRISMIYHFEETIYEGTNSHNCKMSIMGEK